MEGHEAPEESIENGIETHFPQSFEDCTFYTIRHGKAVYQMDKSIISGEDPESAFDPLEQDFTSDLTPEGIEEAAKRAEAFLAQFDPEKDILYFASSNLIRARETAFIYLQEAQRRGFEIIQSEPRKSHKIHQNVHSELGGNQIRTLESLSLNVDHMVSRAVFSPHNQIDPAEPGFGDILYPDKISPSVLNLIKQARRMVEADNRGTWGKNSLAHSAKIKALFADYAASHPDEKIPTIQSDEDMNIQKFRGMLREMKAVKNHTVKFKENHGKRVRVLGFSHENAFLHFLDEEFGQQGISNLEAVGYEVIQDEEGVDHYIAAIENRDHTESIKEIQLPKRSAA